MSIPAVNALSVCLLPSDQNVLISSPCKYIRWVFLKYLNFVLSWKKRFSVHLYAGAHKEESLWKHPGDLGVCTPFSCATESLEHCNEPNWAKQLGTREWDRHFWKHLQDLDLVCGPGSFRGSLDSRSLQCQWSKCLDREGGNKWCKPWWAS